MSDNTSNYIPLFRSLFKGREDVFAIRWEKGAKSGYMPAYFYDPYRYKAHVLKGGTFQTFTEKSYLPLADEQISKHLNGKQYKDCILYYRTIHLGLLQQILIRRIGQKNAGAF